MSCWGTMFLGRLVTWGAAPRAVDGTVHFSIFVFYFSKELKYVYTHMPTLVGK